MKVSGPSLLLSLGVLVSSSQAVTVYYPAGAQAPLASGAGSGAAANYTGAAAYNPTTLNPPPPPGPTAVPTHFSIQPADTVPPGASIPQKGSFFGFSVEMSVVNQVGKFSHPSSISEKNLNLLVEQWERMRSFCSFPLLDHQLM